MKPILSFLFALMLAVPVFAQQTESIPLIEVEGYAERKIAPDEAVFSISLEEKAMKVTDAVEALNQKTQRLAESLKKGKIRDYKLIADNYSVDVNRIYRSGSARDSGYVARQTLRIETNATNPDLQKIVDAIQNAGDMSFNLSFGIAEATRKSLENELLVEALKNAEAKAQLIGNTLAIRSLKVHHVSIAGDYFPAPKLMLNARAEASTMGADMLIQTDDQTISKRVYVKYTY